VADSSALEETTVDDPALSTDMSFDVSVPFVGNEVPCPVCLEREIERFLFIADRLGQAH
jgi:hypothetical protein